MSTDNRKNIQSEKIDYSYIGIMSSKLKIGIIGAGRAGFIKAKHFAKNGCYVEIIAKEFSKEIIELSKEAKLKLINDEFTIEFLKDKHLIVIAVNDEILKKNIREYCEKNYKIYIDSSDFKNGMGIVPVEVQSKNIMAALNTKLGNPKGTLLLSRRMKNILEEYDDFIEFTSKVRNNAKSLPKYKKDVINLIGTDEFEKLYKENKYEEFLRKIFPYEVVEFLLKWYFNISVIGEIFGG